MFKEMKILEKLIRNNDWQTLRPGRDDFFFKRPPSKTLIIIKLTLPHKKSPSNEELLFHVAVWTRLELATPCVTGRYSNQLNYQTNSF